MTPAEQGWYELLHEQLVELLRKAHPYTVRAKGHLYDDIGATLMRAEEGPPEILAERSNTHLYHIEGVHRIGILSSGTPSVHLHTFASVDCVARLIEILTKRGYTAVDEGQVQSPQPWIELELNPDSDAETIASSVVSFDERLRASLKMDPAGIEDPVNGPCRCKSCQQPMGWTPSGMVCHNQDCREFRDTPAF